MLLGLAKTVANSTAALVLKAKNVAAKCEDQPTQNRVSDCSETKKSNKFNIRSCFMYHESFLKVNPTECLPKECFILTK